MTSTDLILIESNRRNLEGTPSSFQLELNENLEGTYELSTFNITNSFYNVVSSENNIINFTHSTDGALIAILTPGFYTPLTLLTEIKTQMDSAGVITYSIDYSTSTGKYTFTPSAGTFGFTFLTNTSSSARRLLGKNEVDDITASSQVSDNVIELKLHDIICIKIAQDNGTHVTLSDGTECSFIIPIKDRTFGEVIHYQRNTNFGQFAIFNSSISTLNIDLFANDGDLLQTNGIDWSMSLKKLY